MSSEHSCPEGSTNMQKCRCLGHLVNTCTGIMDQHKSKLPSSRHVTAKTPTPFKPLTAEVDFGGAGAAAAVGAPAAAAVGASAGAPEVAACICRAAASLAECTEAAAAAAAPGLLHRVSDMFLKLSRSLLEVTMPSIKCITDCPAGTSVVTTAMSELL